MKSGLTILLVGAFMSLAVFGTFAMSNGAEHGHNGCIAAIAQGIDCPKEEGWLSFIMFHLDAFRSFSRAILTLLGLFSGIFIVFLILLGTNPQQAKEELVLISRVLGTAFCPNIQTKFRNWFEYTEKRDPAF